jgi:hypothetical protein
MSFELILPFLQPIEPLSLDDSVREIKGSLDGLRGGSCESLTHIGQR